MGLHEQVFGGGSTIASLQDSAAASNPPASNAGAQAFGGAPTISGNPIDSGERSVGAVSAQGDPYPTVFGGDDTRQLVDTPIPRKVNGQSASGAQGAH